MTKLSILNLKQSWGLLFPGFLISALVAFSAQFISNNYGAPSMLIALLFGIALNFLSQEKKTRSGIQFSANQVLRFGIGLLGLRISLNMLTDLGLSSVLLVVGALILTITFGLLVAPLFRRRHRFAFLSAGSVAICGVSAAIAIAAILPKDSKSENRLVFTVVGITVLSTISMIIYPVIANILGFNDRSTGIFLGATIHDVAQVVGAGFSVSNKTGEIAILVKLIRVSMLAPVIAIASIVIYSKQKNDANKPSKLKILPFFVVAFILLAILNSMGFVPQYIKEFIAPISQWAILMAISAVGMKTSIGEVIKIGGSAIALLVTETLFLGIIVATGLWFFKL